MVAQNFKLLVSTEELEKNLRNSRWRIFDCRFQLTAPEAGRNAFKQSHIPGAVYAHLNEDLSSPVTPESGRHPLPIQDAFIEKLQHWGVSKDAQIVVYDDTFGAIAARMWWMLRWLGFPAVAVLDGGLAAWNRENRPLTEQVATYQASRLDDLKSTVDENMWVDHHIVTASLDDQRKVIIDARAEQRFLGIVEPIDSKAGHIPGAVNIPYEDNLALDGKFLEPDELKGVYADSVKARRPEDVICMCGSGVTACHNILALELAGVHGSKLYVGSWSEWIRDAERPIVSE